VHSVWPAQPQAESSTRGRTRVRACAVQVCTKVQICYISCYDTCDACTRQLQSSVCAAVLHVYTRLKVQSLRVKVREDTFNKACSSPVNVREVTVGKPSRWSSSRRACVLRLCCCVGRVRGSCVLLLLLLCTPARTSREEERRANERCLDRMHRINIALTTNTSDSAVVYDVAIKGPAELVPARCCAELREHLSAQAQRRKPAAVLHMCNASVLCSALKQLHGLQRCS
jgi:hypothetical protein